MPLTDRQRTDLFSAFNVYDYNRSGSLNLPEQLNFMQSLGQNPSEEELDAMITGSKDEGNQDGEVTFEEFVKFMSNIMETGDTNEELEDAFKVFNKSGNGTLTPDELVTVMENLGCQIKLEEAEEIFKEGDKDSDNKINFQEFVTVMHAV